MTALVNLGKLIQIPVGEARGFTPQNDSNLAIFVVHTEKGLFAYRDICPHDGSTTLPWRKNSYLNSSGTRIVCGAHGATFTLDTGLCDSGPCLGASLKAVPLSVNKDGDIIVSVKR